MRILFDLRLLVKGRLSGVEEYTRNLIDGLLAIDEENEYLFFYNGFWKKPLPQTWTQKNNVQAIDWRIPNRLFDFSERWLNFPKIDSIFKPDIVFSPHLNLLKVNPATKKIMTFHDLSFVHFPEFFLPRKIFWHWSQDYERQAREANLIVTDSNFTKLDLMKTFGLEAKKIQCVYPGINQSYNSIPLPNEALNAFAVRHGLNHPFLLFVGVLEPRKNIPALIRAFNVLKRKKHGQDLKLVIVGEKGWRCDTIFQEIECSPHQREIMIWGRATFEDLHRLYNLASVFVYPSFFEGFGFPPLEAQACGLPVVASNRSSLPEILGDSALLVDPWRVDELILATESILLSSVLRNNLKVRGHENVKRFDWLKTAKTMLNLFNLYA